MIKVGAISWGVVWIALPLVSGSAINSMALKVKVSLLLGLHMPRVIRNIFCFCIYLRSVCPNKLT